MGHIHYSTVRHPPDADSVEADIVQISAELWGAHYRVERIQGIPTTPEDDRIAMWCLFVEGSPTSDAAFSLAMCPDGRFEFKATWDISWSHQQMLRCCLENLYNGSPKARSWYATPWRVRPGHFIPGRYVGDGWLGPHPGHGSWAGEMALVRGPFANVREAAEAARKWREEDGKRSTIWLCLVNERDMVKHCTQYDPDRVGCAHSPITSAR